MFIGARYKAKPVIWLLGGDVVGSAHPNVWANLAKGLAEGISGVEDYSTSLMSFHPYGGYSSSMWFHDAPWLDFNEWQTGHFIGNCSEYAIGADYALTPPHPVVIGEANFENIASSFNPANPKLNAYEVRRAAYTALFAGAFGHTYGANEVYMFWDPGENDYGAQIWGADTPWRQALDFPGAFQMQYLRALMESRKFGTHVPDQRLFVNGAWPCQVAARGNDDSYAFVYFADASTTQIDLAKVTGTVINAWWFNPRSGEATFIGQYAPTTRSFTPPSAEDWVLVLDDASHEYTPPGVVSLDPN
jgi:hypothetical protein